MVAAELHTVLPDLVLVPAGTATSFNLEVSDLGLDYRVRAGTSERVFADAVRRCDERARKAAVFGAMVLEPPSIDAGAIRRAAPPSKDLSPTFQLELGGVVDVGPRPGADTAVSGGGQLRGYLGGRYVGAVLGVSGLSPTTLELTKAEAQLTRVPIDLGVRGVLPRGRWTAALDLGPAMTLQITEGLKITPSIRETRLEFGIRLAARVEYWGWKRVAPFFAFQGEVVPAPSNLTVGNAGVVVVGTPPQRWLGAVLGAAFRVR
jgi:hypothetical protein